MRSKGKACWVIATLAALVVLPQVAAAQGETGNVCVRDYRGGAVCTANDVRIEELTVVSVVEDCVSGTPGETEVQFEALVSSAGSPNRYDIGLFLALDGGSARDGDDCYHDFLSGPLTPTPTYGDKNSDTIPDVDGGPWWNGGTDADLCGDLETNTQVFTDLPALRFACIDNNGDGSADVSVCASWDNNVGTACNSVVGAFPGTNSKCSCGTVELGIAPEPAITIVKSPANQNVLSGGTANFTFTVTSKTTVSNVVVTDPDCDAPPAFVGGDTNNDTVLTPDETWTYSCSKAGVLASFMNTVTVTGNGPLGMVSDTDSANVTVASAAMTLVKTGVHNDANMDGFAQAGETITYSFVVTNTGTVPLTNVAVSDPMVAPITCPSGNPIPTLAVLAMETCTGSYVIVQADVDAGQKVNTATATSNETPPVMDTETVMLPAPGMTLVKTGVFNDANMDGAAQAGETISYSFVVTNTGTIPLTNVAVSDPMVAPITCPSGNPIPTLAVLAMETCTGSYVIVQADVDAGQKVNTATATSNETPPANSTTTVTLPGNPELSLVKTGALDLGGDGVANPGDLINYTFQVTNTGDQTLTNVSVTDPLVSPITCPSGNPIPTLALGASETCTGSYTLIQADINAGQVANTATADSDQTPPTTDTEMVPVPTAPAVTATKTSSFDPATQDNDGSGTLTPGDDLTYTVVVTNTGIGAALGVVFNDTPDPNTTLGIGTVTTTQGTVVSGNTAGDTNVSVDVGTLAAGGGSVTITFEVTINVPFPAGVSQVVNQGVATGSNFPPILTDDPNPPGGSDPTTDIVTIAAVPTVLDIPTLSEWGILFFSLLLAAAALRLVRR